MPSSPDQNFGSPLSSKRSSFPMGRHQMQGRDLGPWSHVNPLFTAMPDDPADDLSPSGLSPAMRQFANFRRSYEDFKENKEVGRDFSAGKSLKKPPKNPVKKPKSVEKKVLAERNVLGDANGDGMIHVLADKSFEDLENAKHRTFCVFDKDEGSFAKPSMAMADLPSPFSPIEASNSEDSIVLPTSSDESLNLPLILDDSPILPQSPLCANDPNATPYDPQVNLLSPRPQFLRYRPDWRIELLSSFEETDTHQRVGETSPSQRKLSLGLEDLVDQDKEKIAEVVDNSAIEENIEEVAESATAGFKNMMADHVLGVHATVEESIASMDLVDVPLHEDALPDTKTQEMQTADLQECGSRHGISKALLSAMIFGTLFGVVFCLLVQIPALAPHSSNQDSLPLIWYAHSHAYLQQIKPFAVNWIEKVAPQHYKQDIEALQERMEKVLSSFHSHPLYIELQNVKDYILAYLSEYTSSIWFSLYGTPQHYLPLEENAYFDDWHWFSEYDILADEEFFGSTYGSPKDATDNLFNTDSPALTALLSAIVSGTDDEIQLRYIEMMEQDEYDIDAVYDLYEEHLFSDEDYPIGFSDRIAIDETKLPKENTNLTVDHSIDESRVEASFDHQYSDESSPAEAVRNLSNTEMVDLAAGKTDQEQRNPMAKQSNSSHYQYLNGAEVSRDESRPLITEPQLSSSVSLLADSAGNSIDSIQGELKQGSHISRQLNRVNEIIIFPLQNWQVDLLYALLLIMGSSALVYPLVAKYFKNQKNKCKVQSAQKLKESKVSAKKFSVMETPALLASPVAGRFDSQSNQDSSPSPNPNPKSTPAGKRQGRKTKSGEMIVASEASLEDGSSPYGSFTAYKHTLVNEGSGAEKILKLTPVRRSSRIRGQVISPVRRRL